MRRALPLLWLLAFALAQAAPAACPMGSQARRAPAPGVATMPEHGASAGHSAEHPAHPRHLPDSHPVPCVASVCVVGAVAVSAAVVDALDPGAPPATLAPPSFYRSPLSRAETPPPRTPALS